MLPFTTFLQSENRIIGSTRFGNYDAESRRVEIGWTWITPGLQRSGANVEAKLLMMTHAFEQLGCNRVEFKTDVLNEKSRNALLGIGATEEGILRQHPDNEEAQEGFEKANAALACEALQRLKERKVAEVAVGESRLEVLEDVGVLHTIVLRDPCHSCDRCDVDLLRERAVT